MPELLTDGELDEIEEVFVGAQRERVSAETVLRLIVEIRRLRSENAQLLEALHRKA